MSTETVSLWAVVQTGAHTIAGDVVPFVTPDGKRCPAVLFTHADYQTCIRRRKRLLLIASRHRQLGPPGSSDMLVATPLLGVVPLQIEIPKKKDKKSATIPTDGIKIPHAVLAPLATPATTEPVKRSEKHKDTTKAA